MKTIEFLIVWISRIFCLHQWENNLTSKNYLNGLVVYGQGIMKAWICKRCGKEIMSFIEPISYYCDAKK